jgi:hypothetical protein
LNAAVFRAADPRRRMTHVLALNPLSATDLLTSFGTIGILVVLFAETGLLIGFFLPRGLAAVHRRSAVRHRGGQLAGACRGCWSPRRPVRCSGRRSGS